METIFSLNPLIFPNPRHAISKKDFKTRDIYYILDSKREFPFNHSIESQKYNLYLIIEPMDYIKSVLEFLFRNYSRKSQISNPVSIRVSEILDSYSRVEFTLENLLNLNFESYLVDRTPGLVGVVINLSRLLDSVEYKTLLSRHVNKLLGICRIKDVSDRLRIPRSFVLYGFLLKMGE